MTKQSNVSFQHVELAKRFEEHVRKDERFEVVCVNFALVCFRLKVNSGLK